MWVALSRACSCAACGSDDAVGSGSDNGAEAASDGAKSDIAAADQARAEVVAEVAPDVAPACTTPADCGANPGPCQAWTCDGQLGCVAVARPDGAVCVHPDACIEGGTCSAAVCKGGAPKSCDDAKPCAKEACDKGACTNNAASDGTACDDVENHLLRRVAPDGTVTTMAGSPATGKGFQDGKGTYARFNGPYGLDIDAAGNLFGADYGNNRIRKVGQTARYRRTRAAPMGTSTGRPLSRASRGRSTWPWASTACCT
jgi:hypothetical protein